MIIKGIEIPIHLREKQKHYREYATFDVDANNNISDVIKFLQDAKEKSPDATVDVYVSTDGYGDRNYGEIQVNGLVEETDSEYNSRLDWFVQDVKRKAALEKQRLEDEARREKAEYERLKKKFEGK